ncbi:MAG: WGR domain-containing protein [Myxococcota bacterium]
MNMVDSIELFFQEGAADKLYNAQIVEENGTYTVNVQWGRRGRKLNTGTKALNTTEALARKAYDKVIRQKQKKGYEIRTDDAQPAAVAPAEGMGSASKAGIQRRDRLGTPAQLLNAVEEPAVEALLADPMVLVQQKFDGVRVVVHVNAEVQAANRNGEVSTLDAAVAAALKPAPAGTIIDGELVPGEDGPTYRVFDLLALGGDDLRALPYAERYARLNTLCAGLAAPIVLVDTARTPEQKRALFDTLRQARAEGVVFKRSDAPYTAGRPASGGTQLKFKFVHSADVFITNNAGNAYQMAVYEGDTLREVGKVFAGTSNATRSQLDAALSAGEQPVAEVRYLYATEADLLYQPVFVRIRTDKTPAACAFGQLNRTNRSVVGTFSA